MEKIENYYYERIRSLTDQLDNAQRKVASQESYITKLEKALTDSTSKCAKLEKALIEAAVRNVEV